MSQIYYDLRAISSQEIKSITTSFVRSYIRDHVIESDGSYIYNIAWIDNIDINKLRYIANNDGREELEKYLSDSLMESLDIWENCCNNITIFIKLFNDVINKLENNFSFTDMRATVSMGDWDPNWLSIEIINGKQKTKNVCFSLSAYVSENDNDFRWIDQYEFIDEDNKCIDLDHNYNDDNFRKKFSVKKLAELKKIAKYEDDNTIDRGYRKNRLSLNDCMIYCLYYFMPNKCFE